MDLHLLEKDSDKLPQKNIIPRQCKCGSRKTQSMLLQSRSADEGGILHVKCFECDNEWKFSV